MIIQKEKTDFKNIKFNILPIHEQLSKLDFNNNQKDFDASSLCLSAMWDDNSNYPNTETGYAFKPHMNNVYMEAFKNQTFNQYGNEFAILKIILQSNLS